MSRKEYVFLFEKLAAAGAGAEDAYASTKVGSSQGLSPPLTPREQRRLCELEEELPLQTILMFRTMARKEVVVIVVVIDRRLSLAVVVGCVMYL